MKLSTAAIFISASFSTASAFNLQQKTNSKTSSTKISEQKKFYDPNIPDTSSPEMSKALPFQRRPHALDGSLAGDVGFDPIGFASDKEALWNYREAEVRIDSGTVHFELCDPILP